MCVLYIYVISHTYLYISCLKCLDIFFYLDIRWYLKEMCQIQSLESSSLQFFLQQR